MFKVDDLDIDYIHGMCKNNVRELKHGGHQYSMIYNQSVRIFNIDKQPVGFHTTDLPCANPFRCRLLIHIKGLWISHERDTFGVDISIKQIIVKDVDTLPDGCHKIDPMIFLIDTV